MKNKLILSIVIILSIFVFLISFINNKCYAEHSDKHTIIENLIVETSGVSASNFSSASKYAYFVYKNHELNSYDVLVINNTSHYTDNSPDYYWGSFRYSGCANFNHWIYAYGTFNFYVYRINSSDLSVETIKTLNMYYYNSSTVDLAELLGCYSLNVSNLMYVSDNILSNVQTYYTNFVNQDDVTLPYLDIDRSDNLVLNSLEYIDISPSNTFLISSSGTIYTNPITLQILEYVTGDENQDYSVKYSISLSKDSSYWYEDDYIYRIPKTLLDTLCAAGNTYSFAFIVPYEHTYVDLEFKCYESEDNTGDVVLSLGNLDDSGGDAEEDNSNQELIDAITQSNNNLANTITESNQNVVNAIEEQNETSKGILATIGDIVSYLNPLSENFFVYKLIELLVDALKSLFVPSDDFFTNWIDDLNSYFGECFGVLYYPFELLIDFLNRVSSIEDSTAIINIPEFKISFMGHEAVFIKPYSYDFNDLLTNDTFKNVHNVYLVFVDLLLWLGVVFLASKSIRSIVGGISGETISNISTSKKEE